MISLLEEVYYLQLLEDIAKDSGLCPVCGMPWEQAMTIFDGPETTVLQCTSLGCEEQLVMDKPDDDDEDDDEEDADRK